MTEHQKTKLLRKLSNDNMTRVQIVEFCADQTGYDGEREIDLLRQEKLIDMISDPYWNRGVFTPKPDDLFGISDYGRDHLDSIRKERFRLYLPIAVSILSVIVAFASFIVSVIALAKSG